MKAGEQQQPVLERYKAWAVRVLDSPLARDGAPDEDVRKTLI